MMRALVDNDVVMDLMLLRQPWVSEAQAILQSSNNGLILPHIASLTLSNVFYVARKLRDTPTARQIVRTCLQVFEVVTVDRSTLVLADSYAGADFEDNVQIACAVQAELDVIVTRNEPDFADSPVLVLSSSDLLKRLAGVADVRTT